MGILNCTPDSFSDGQNGGVEVFVEKALRLASEGADIIDIGGESTRPGALPLEASEELHRIIPVIRKLRQQSQICISVDTYKAEVAEQALDAGANIINDISAGRDPLMPKIAAKYGVEAILMHMQGKPKTMQNRPQYTDVLAEVKFFLEQQSRVWREAGVAPEKIIWDPGIGFGKSLEHNLTLMANLDYFGKNQRILLGASRKSFIAGVDPYASSPQARLGGSLASLTLAISQGVDMVRVHDVQETRQFISIVQAIQRFRKS
jgi:dihydropteroate synthase